MVERQTELIVMVVIKMIILNLYLHFYPWIPRRDTDRTEGMKSTGSPDWYA